MDNAVRWDLARLWVSALDAACDRGFEVELAIRNDLHADAMLHDFAKLFDHMDGQLLGEAGLELGFPQVDFQNGPLLAICPTQVSCH